MGLPKSYIKKYGITKKAWRMFRRKGKVARRRRRGRTRTVTKYRYRTRRPTRRRSTRKSWLTKLLAPIEKHAELAGAGLVLFPVAQQIMSNPSALVSKAQTLAQEAAANPLGLVSKIANPTTVNAGIGSVVTGIAAKVLPSFGKIGSFAKRGLRISSKVGMGIALGTAVKEVIS